MDVSALERAVSPSPLAIRQTQRRSHYVSRPASSLFGCAVRAPSRAARASAGSSSPWSARPSTCSTTISGLRRYSASFFSTTSNPSWTRGSSSARRREGSATSRSRCILSSRPSLAASASSYRDTRIRLASRTSSSWSKSPPARSAHTRGKRRRGSSTSWQRRNTGSGPGRPRPHLSTAPRSATKRSGCTRA
jgi:hypothetical protein